MFQYIDPKEIENLICEETNTFQVEEDIIDFFPT